MEKSYKGTDSLSESSFERRPIQYLYNDPDGYQLNTYLDEPEAKIQTRTGANYYVWMVGRAMRVCYHIDPPELRKFYDVDVTPANRLDRGEGFMEWFYADYGHACWAAVWKLRYMLPKLPSSGDGRGQGRLQAIGPEQQFGGLAQREPSGFRGAGIYDPQTGGIRPP